MSFDLGLRRELGDREGFYALASSFLFRWRERDRSFCVLAGSSLGRLIRSHASDLGRGGGGGFGGGSCAIERGEASSNLYCLLLALLLASLLVYPLAR
jgi:hypothetical protein